MSATRMMILGVVSWLEPVHGYDVRRELLSWSADRWANVQPGSIYHALRKLAGEGLLRELPSEQVGARPARTRYEITEKGRAEFHRLLSDLMWDVKPVADPFASALAFLPAVPPDEAAAALRQRAKVLRTTVEGFRSAATSGWLGDKPPHVGWMFELFGARGDAEAQWCERIADRIESGASYTWSEEAADTSSNNQG
ncbi:PadR family transcriptional regulator [Rhizomonospora bruguierae]|uniref:PadR family transcriptional regulator n=1 Tax=Rhizomonospora bruguierae TaxID=1581705 RepID=UPI0020BE13A8|nr:PadR family transcriptional regulator [Micromonospora sp. NBRC 107566]